MWPSHCCRDKFLSVSSGEPGMRTFLCSGGYQSEMGLAALKAGRVPSGGPRGESISFPFAASRGSPAFLGSRPADSGDTVPASAAGLVSSFCLGPPLSLMRTFVIISGLLDDPRSSAPARDLHLIPSAKIPSCHLPFAGLGMRMWMDIFGGPASACRTWPAQVSSVPRETCSPSSLLSP